MEKRNGLRIKIWVSDALNDEHIAALVDDIAMLIEAYTGEKPILK